MWPSVRRSWAGKKAKLIGVIVWAYAQRGVDRPVGGRSGEWIDISLSRWSDISLVPSAGKHNSDSIGAGGGGRFARAAVFIAYFIARTFLETNDRASPSRGDCSHLAVVSSVHAAEWQWLVPGRFRCVAGWRSDRATRRCKGRGRVPAQRHRRSTKPSMDKSRERRAADDDGVSAEGCEHGCGGRRLSGWGLQHSRDRSRGRRGLRLAHAEGRSPAFVLKRSRSGSGPHWDGGMANAQESRASRWRCRTRNARHRPAARTREEWGIDAHKIGVLGFSARRPSSPRKLSNQAKLVLAHRSTPPTGKSSRPYFSVVLYPGLHVGWRASRQGLKFGLRASAATPPTFDSRRRTTPSTTCTKRSSTTSRC